MAITKDDILSPKPCQGHSAVVRMDLLVDGRRIPIAQAGGGKLIFNPPVPLPPCTGEYILSIDGEERRWRVTLRPTSQPAHIVPTEFEELP